MATVLVPSRGVSAERQQIVFYAAEVAAKPTNRCDLILDCADYQQVGKLASRIASVVYDEVYVNDAEQIRTTAEYVGWLLYAIDHRGCSFEDVLSGSSYRVASAVAEVSEDLRMVQPRRALERLSRFGMASAPSQIAKLAEIRIQLEKLARPDGENSLNNMGDLFKLWVDDQASLIGAMTQIRDLPQARSELKAAYAAIDHVRNLYKLGKPIPNKRGL